ncbi:Polyketide synthase PksJ [Stieleria maiorica]|uniref:Polyketide synthase PksJ n=1 Tax=Stieleria maiorica TaxID=2795974 RepID=A0A5B9ML22_9BACT|nr:type I polyketide synthase [Stieleria maiorica]QEG00266.1 Polyketide synthase PksJ [Stieleria maiorica]
MNSAPNHPPSENRSADTPLAVIGMACRLPGASDLDEYWSLMIEGRSAIAELPAERLDQRRYYDPEPGQFGKTYSKIGGIVGDRTAPIEPFRLTDHDIENADHSHLDLCQVAGQAIRDAGLDPHATESTRGGVFVGHQRGSNLIGELTLGVMAAQAMDCLRQTDHVSRLAPREQAALVAETTARVRRDLPKRNPGGGPLLESSEAARLISKAFGLDGPCLSINAACSSSLVALAAGAHALQTGDIDLAVIGGLSYCKLDALILFSQAQTVSATGSRPFDADADGLVAAEGYVVAVVKTLERALADKDPIRAVIRGIGVSSDGKGKSLWAPRREGQIAAVRRAYSADVTPSSVQYVEAHATSTPVGDSTEINSLAEAFNESFGRPPDRKIPLGSVKANIGHTLEAAGLAGLVKTVLAMQHRMIPPLINLRRPSPNVDWAAAPFQLPTTAIPWPDPPPDGPRRAGVNAFGIGGLNVHVVLEEYLPDTSIRLRSRRDTAPEDRSIAVVGAALLVPGARTIDQFWDLMSSGRDPKIPVPADRWDVTLDHGDDAKHWVGGFIRDYQYDWRRHRVPPKQVANADPLQFMILDTVAEALQASGYESKLDREHTAVIVGNLVGGEASSQLLVGLRLPVLREVIETVLREKGIPAAEIARTSRRFAEVLLERMPALLDETGGFSNSSLASRITKTYDLMGGAFALDSSDNSSIMAVNTARGFLLRGDCKMVIAAGAQRDLGPHAFECLRLSGRLSPSGRVRSLDQNSDGMAPAEGVAVVLLKKLRDAKADGDEILSVIREIGVARHDDQQTSQRIAIGRALAGAGVTADQISAVELSAGGVAGDDRDEFQAIAQAYAAEREQPLHLRSLAGQLGHTGSAAGMIALVKSSLALSHLQSPVGRPPELPIDCVSNQSWCEFPATSRDLPVVDPSGRVYSTLHCHARGMASHVVIERGQPVPAATAQPGRDQTARPAVDRDHAYRSWICQADSPSGLIDIATQVAAGGAIDPIHPSRDIGPPSDQRHSLAIVYRTDDELRTKAELFVSSHAHPKRKALFQSQGIYCVERSRWPKVAFLFPGQGSQYPSMLTELVQTHPVASAAAERIDAILKSLQFPSYRDLVVDQADLLGQDVWRTQLSLLVADSILMEVVDAMGIRPDRISAHSYGEFPALVAAGAWDFTTAAVATYHRCRLITESKEIDGAMLAVDLDRHGAQTYCNATPGEAFVANCNSDRQTVIAGSRTAIENLKSRMVDAGVHARILNVPRPYHTPLMAPIQTAFRQQLDRLGIAPPRTPLLSSVDNRYVAEPDSIRENLVRQLVQPVLYTDQIRRLVDEGVNVLVEIGPSPVLTRLHEQIVGDELLWIATDNKKRHHDESLARLDAALRAAGVPIGQSDDMETRLRLTVSDTATPVGSRQTADLQTTSAGSRQRPGSTSDIEQAEPTPDMPVGSRQTADLQTTSAGSRQRPGSTSGGQQAEPTPDTPVGSRQTADLQTTSAGSRQRPGSTSGIEQAEPTPDTPVGSRQTADLQTTSAGSRQRPGSTSGIEQAEPTPDTPVGSRQTADLQTTSAGSRQRPGSTSGIEQAEPTPDTPVGSRQTTDLQTTSAGSRQRPGSSINVQESAANAEAGLPLLFLEGSPRQMGAAHGQSMTSAIHRMLDRYKEIAAGKFGRTLPELSRAKSMLDTLVDDSALQEVRGMADGAGVPVEALLEHNLYAYPEIGAGCTQVLAGRPSSTSHPAARPTETQWLHAANEDMPLGLFLRDTMRRCVQIRRPTAGFPHLLFSAAGHVLGINGVNAAGVVVTSSMLLDRPRRAETADGLLHSIVIRRVLESCKSVDDAVSLLRRERTTGGWGICISDAIGTEPAYVEYDCGTFQSKRIHDRHLVSNHAQLLPAVAKTPRHSLLRQQRLESLWRLKDDQDPSTAMLQRWMRDQYDEGRGREVRFATMNTIRRVDNQVSVLFDVRSGRAWTTPGNHEPSADANQFFELDLETLIGFQPAPQTRPRVTATRATENAPARASDRVITWQEFSQRSHAFGGRAANVGAGKVCDRFVLRCIQTPPAPQADVAATLQGGVLLLGDNAAADAFAESLQRAGVRCLHLRRLDDVDAATSFLDDFCRTGVPTNVFLLTAWDKDAALGASVDDWQRRRQSGLLVPYQLCQRWMTLLAENGLVGEGRIVGGVRLGGLLGFDDSLISPEGGFATGLVKGLLIELGFAAQTSFRARVVDFDQDADPHFIAARLIDEAASSAGRTAEVSYRGGKRHVVAPLHQPADQLPSVNPDFGEVWIITGGARGVTAKIAKAIGEQFGVKLHLIGSSPLPEIEDGWRNLSSDQRKQLRAEVVRKALQAGEVPIDAWSRVEKALEIDENLRAFAKSGLDVTYHACDVSDHRALARLLDRIRQTDGRIDGIIHGAGYEKASSFAKKKLASVERTIASKVDGAVSLMELTRQDDLKVFAAFASISGRFGGVGQTDYCLANELLCKLVSWFRKTRPEVHAVAFDWPSWDEVGMAVRPESRLAKTLVDAKYMPVDEGVAHFIDELQRGCPEGEVLVTDWERYKRYYTDHYVSSLSPYPMIDRVQDLDGANGHGITTARDVDPVNDNFLSQHLLRGRPILPFVAAAEACAETASLLTGGLAVNGLAVTTIENFRIVESMRFFTDQPQEIRVRAERSGDQIRCSMLSDFKNRKGQVLRKDRVHAECVIRSDQPDGAAIDTVEFPDVPYVPVHYLDHKLSVYHGPIYRQLEQFYYSRQESWAKIRIADPAEFLSAESGDSVLLPCVLIDTCVFSAGVHEWTIDRTSIALPHSIRRLRTFSPPVVGQQVTARITPLESTDKYATFNIDVWDQHRRPVLQIENYRANVLVATIPLDRAQSTH